MDPNLIIISPFTTSLLKGEGKKTLTLLSATSGSSHGGSVAAASTNKNSPSLSVTFTQTSSNCLLSSRNKYTITHSSSIESPYSVRPRNRLNPFRDRVEQKRHIDQHVGIQMRSKYVGERRRTSSPSSLTISSLKL